VIERSAIGRERARIVPASGGVAHCRSEGCANASAASTSQSSLLQAMFQAIVHNYLQHHLCPRSLLSIPLYLHYATSNPTVVARHIRPASAASPGNLSTHFASLRAPRAVCEPYSRGYSGYYMRICCRDRASVESPVSFCSDATGIFNLMPADTCVGYCGRLRCL
jgi:hypothetical protein